MRDWVKILLGVGGGVALALVIALPIVLTGDSVDVPEDPGKTLKSWFLQKFVQVPSVSPTPTLSSSATCGQARKVPLNSQPRASTAHSQKSMLTTISAALVDIITVAQLTSI